MYIFRRCSVLVLAAVLFWVSSAPTQAHFLLNLNVRILHIEHTRDGLRIFIRTPMPYFVADKLGDAPEGELPPPVPFTTNAFEDGALVHYVDFAALMDDPAGFAALVIAGYRIDVNGVPLEARFEQLRIHPVGTQPGFATLEEAKSVMSGPPLAIPEAPLYVGDAVVDVELFYPTSGAVTRYSVSSTLNPGLPGQEDTANLLLDYGPGHPQIFRSRGLMSEPLDVSRSPLSAVTTFVWEGMRHILEGLDHVLFVICLVIGATTLSSLMWRVTGFTVGHSVTLALGFFGFVPSAPWFIPAVETGIALSIIYAAVLALWPRAAGHGGNRQVLWVTAAIGLLHGLGFSFVLQKILQVDAPNIWQSLLAFNIGVEVGQLAIVLAVWPVLLVLKRVNVAAWSGARIVMAASCTAVAAIWTVERLAQVAATL